MFHSFWAFLWNSLSPIVTSSTSLLTFKRRLNTDLFTLSYMLLDRYHNYCISKCFFTYNATLVTFVDIINPIWGIKHLNVNSDYKFGKFSRYVQEKRHRWYYCHKRLPNKYRLAICTTSPHVYFCIGPLKLLNSAEYSAANWEICKLSQFEMNSDLRLWVYVNAVTAVNVYMLMLDLFNNTSLLFSLSY